MTDAELATLETKYDSETRDYVDDWDVISTDVRRLVAEIERARAENEQLKRGVMSVVQGEIRRAEAMDGKPEYPKRYADGRYRTAVEILGQITKMFRVEPPKREGN